MIRISIFALLLAYCGVTANAQTASINYTPFITKEIIALNFIKDISFPPGISNLKYNSQKAISNEASHSIENISALQFKYAMLMNVDVESILNKVLFNFINDWYGTHYRMGGTTKKGIDCSAFTGTLLSSVYSFCVPRTAREQYRICERISKDDLLEGDLVFFNTRGGVSHVGVYLTNNHFVHSSCHGVRISSLDDSYYAKKFIGGGRINQ